jgi:hypothetical protein
MGNDPAFLIAFDLRDRTLDYDAAVKYILDSDDFEAWWNHMPGVFLVITRLRPDEISDRLRAFTKESNLLVVRVDLEDSEGRLSRRAWNWINKRAAGRESASLVAGDTGRH